MKKIIWKNPNKMIFESLHKEFNRQTRLISTGNQVGDTVYSTYVRAYDDCECNDKIFKLGHLQNYDLNWLVKEIPEYVKDWVRAYKKECIVYMFFHRMKGEMKVDGAVITDTQYELLNTFYINRTQKGMSIINEAKKYVVKGD